MAPRVDFYVIDKPTARDRSLFLCRLIEKAYRRGNRLFVQADQAQSSQIDDLLWSFRQGSFVPHERSEDFTGEAAVVIGEKDPGDKHDVLVNLTAGVPDTILQYNRIIEIVYANPDDKAQARQRFRNYRDQGLSVESHNITVN